jgi:hypothetical protein
MTDTPHDFKEIKSSLHTELSEMRSDIHEVREAQIRAADTAERGCDRNAEAHERLISAVNGFKGDRKAAIAIVTVLSIILGGTGTWLVTRTGSVEHEVHELRYEQNTDAARGFQMADDLRNDVDNNEEALDVLQSLHRSRGNESNGLRPGRSE